MALSLSHRLVLEAFKIIQRTNSETPKEPLVLVNALGSALWRGVFLRYGLSGDRPGTPYINQVVLKPTEMGSVASIVSHVEY